MSNSLKNESDISEYLGVKNPLLSPTTLGQDFLAPKFITPLGAKSISRFKHNLFDNGNFVIQNLSERYSGFSQSSLSSNINYKAANIVQQESLTSNISQSIPTYREDSTINLKTKTFSQKPINSEDISVSSYYIKSTSQIQKQENSDRHTRYKKSINKQEKSTSLSNSNN